MALIETLIDATSRLPFRGLVESASGRMLDSIARAMPARSAHACDPTDCSCTCQQCGPGPCACCPQVFCC